MIEIPNAAQIRAWDSYTIAREPITSIDLMERACNAFVNWFVARFEPSEQICIVCGTGNNGGDGLGIARLLITKKYNVSVWVIESQNHSEDFKKNYDRLPKQIFADKSDKATILIDAIFGSGLSRPVDGVYASAIEKINASKAIKVAVDVPSGLRLDSHSNGKIVKADHTVTFQSPKVAFMFPENAEYVGEWHVVDIGLHHDYTASENFDCYYVDSVSIRHRKKFSHKGDYGRSLLVAGSLGKMGAAVLAAKAALRSGAGLLTVHVPKRGYNIIQTSVPEAMATVDTNEDHFGDVGDASNYDVIGIGPGIGITVSTISGLRKVLQFGKPMVLDADALNVISQSPDLRKLLRPGSILTPHPGEFARLVGSWSDDFQRLELQRQLASETKCVVILKGAHTSIATPGGKVYFNSTGNPGMAKGGSGDVLTGVVLGLLSQGYPADEAAITGVYMHGLAGDLAVAKTGENALIASDIVEFLGQSFGR